MDPLDSNTVDPQGQQPAESVPATPAPEETPEPENKTPDVKSASEPTDRTVPYGALAEERKKRQELQREIAELKAKGQQGQYDPEDMEKLLAHPFVQDLMMKDAKRELTDHAKDLLESKYKNLHPSVKKAVLANVRGFVKENTRDIESAKLDLEEWVESVYEADAAPAAEPQKKGFPVAAPAAAIDVPGATPSAVEKILQKPVDEWTPEDMKLLDQYKLTQKK